MSKESANKFLEDIAHHHDLRNQFQNVETPQDFIQVAQSLGYQFTSDELKETVKEHSQGVEIRRKTGIWPWLRSVQWIHSWAELASE